MALRRDEARELIEVAAHHGVRLACAPATFLGEAQQTAAAWIRDGRLGPIRAVYADVSHGRIETWHPAPQGFFDVGVLVDVAVYPLTLVTTMVGPARSVRAWGWDLLPDRVTVDGTPFRIGRPDLIVAADRARRRGGAPADGLVLRRPAGQVPRRPRVPRRPGSFALGNFQEFNASVEPDRRRRLRGGPWSASPSPASLGTRGRGPPRRSPRTDPTARRRAGRPRVDILDAAARSMADAGRRSRWGRRSRRLR
jgi:predicted dehydrogenase